MNEALLREQYGIPDSASALDKTEELSRNRSPEQFAGLSSIGFKLPNGGEKRICKVVGNHMFFIDTDGKAKLIDTSWVLSNGIYKTAATRHTIEVSGSIARYRLGATDITLDFGGVFEPDGIFMRSDMGNGLTAKVWAKGAKFEKWITGVGHPNLPLSADGKHYILTIPGSGLPTATRLGKKTRTAGEAFLRGGNVWSAAKLSEIIASSFANGITKLLPVDFFEDGVEWTTDATAYYAGAGDGDVRAVQNADWATTRNDTTGASNTDTTSPSLTLVDVGATYDIYRSFLPIDTSGINDTDTVSAAVLKLYGTDKGDGDNDGQDYIVTVAGTQASTSSLENSDIDNVGATAWSDTIDIGAFSTVGYNSLTLNATGLTNVSKTGFTKLALREGHDMENAPTVGQNYTRHATSEAGGTSTDPYLDVTTVTGFTPIIIVIS